MGDLNRWLKLILAAICLGIPLNGYVMRVYRGTEPAPDVDQWGTLFMDGLKLLAVGIIYAIPLLILWVFLYGPLFLDLASGTMNESTMASWEPNFVLMIVFYIVDIVVAILMPVAVIRFARAGAFAEAFNFSAILRTIGKIGWIQYIVALVLVSIVIAIPVLALLIGFILLGGASLLLLKEAGLLVFIALLAFLVLLLLILSPLFGVFQARFMTRLYDTARPDQ